MTYISKSKNVLIKEHYAILLDDSFEYDDGYGREGHETYSTKEYMNYISFETEEEMAQWIMENKDLNYKAILVKPLKVKMSISIDIDAS